ncbi:MAG: TrbI/VirB10 family protein [Vicinamibacterales bacterium]
MATAPDPTPGTVPVTDHRPTPAGVFPRRLQTWLMAGLAAGIVGIILLAGEPSPPASRPTAPAAVATPSADRVRDYQDRLRAMEARAALDAAAAAAPPEPLSSTEVTMRTGSEDPTVADRRRREYESLFASNVVLSRRADGSRPLDGAAVPAQTGAALDRLAPVPSADALADAVVRASLRGGAQPLAAAVSPPAALDDPPQVNVPQAPAQTDPISAAGPLHRLLEGTFMDAVLANRLDGTDAAPVIGLVTNPVYAHAGHVVVVPAGARVIGETRPVRTVNDTRLAVAFHRLVMPDGRTYRLEQTRGLNARGDAGLRDQVNRHYWATFGAAGAVGLISGLAQWLGTAGLPGDGNNTVVIGGVANTTAQSALQVMSRFLNRLPTVTIREGHRLKVYLARDLDLPAYDDGTATLWPNEGA